MSGKLRIMIVDDNLLYRQVLTEIVESLEETQVVATAANGLFALGKIPSSHPDLVLCDIDMPILDGISTLKKIKEDHPEIGVVMVSALSHFHATITIQALEHGAIDFVTKPLGGNNHTNKEFLLNSLRPIINAFAAKKKLGKFHSAKLAPVAGPPLDFIDFNLAVIGVSTGGPNALGTVIPQLSANLCAPVLIVQHMPPLFTASLAEHLSQKSALRVIEAQDGQTISAGTVAFAPGGKHMELYRRTPDGGAVVKITDTPPVLSCKPSIDVLFKSVAAVNRAPALGIIMTGMGQDGLAGVKALRQAGGHCLTQSAETCVVYGMPRAVDSAGLSSEQIPLDNMALRINQLLNKH